MKELDELKKEIISKIKETLAEQNIDKLYWADVNDEYSPIIIEGDCDENTYTLDEINVSENGIWGSSCSGNMFCSFNNTPIEALADIYDELGYALTKYKELKKEED